MRKIIVGLIPINLGGKILLPWVQICKLFERNVVIIVLSNSQNVLLCAQKNRLVETVLLSP